MKAIQLVASMSLAAFGLLGMMGGASAASGGAYASDNISIFMDPRNQSNEIIGLLQAGEQVTIDRCTASGKWCRIFHDGPTGWVLASYLVGAAAKNNETPLSSLTGSPFH